jgi:hypothetical protein
MPQGSPTFAPSDNPNGVGRVCAHLVSIGTSEIAQFRQKHFLLATTR